MGNQKTGVSGGSKYAWPRERLLAQGVANLRDEELLALILRTGGKGKNVLALSTSLLRRQSLSAWSKVELGDWLKEEGVDVAKAAALVAAFELAARVGARSHLPRPLVTTPSAAAHHFQPYRNKRKEYVVALYLNARHELIHQEVISIGTVDRSLIHPREVFAPALRVAASSIILAHNHPSGDAQPSPEDLVITRLLTEAGELLQIILVDHLIITSTSVVSLREQGLGGLLASPPDLAHPNPLRSKLSHPDFPQPQSEQESQLQARLIRLTTAPVPSGRSAPNLSNSIPPNQSLTNSTVESDTAVLHEAVSQCWYP